MASILTISTPNLTFPKQNLSVTFPIKRPSRLHFPSQPLCLSLSSVADDNHNSTNNDDDRWDSMLHGFVTGAMKQFESYLNALRKGRGDANYEDWDWNRWCQYFDEVDDQERTVILLKSQLRNAVYVENYEEASRLQVSIVDASKNCSVGKVMSLMKRAIKEDRYSDAAFLRDIAGAGLVGWWAGISKDVNDPYGLIIRINPEHGRYVARSYSPRQLATSAAGVPLFEFFLTRDKKGDFKSQAVYLKRKYEDADSDEDVWQDEWEDEDSDEDEDGDDQEGDDENEINADLGTFEREKQNGLMHKVSSNLFPRDLLRVPAKLEMKEPGSFSFTVENEVNQQDGHDKGKSSSDKSIKFQSRRRDDHDISDVAKFFDEENARAKMVNAVVELSSFSRAQNHQPLLSGSMIFNRIEIPSSFDPLDGLYIGTYGLYSSEVIQMRHRYGQWQEDGRAKATSDLEFYEYVEALKLTGDPYVPAGQVAFRAKVGKMHQLPHKGIIPEKFGVIARYKGEGRLAGPGFQNPRWVDGELVIFDGKVCIFHTGLVI